MWASAIRHGWVVDGDVPGPEVDEFADPGEVIEALAGSDGESLLAVQHPHRTPAALARNLTLPQALPQARRTLDRLLANAYRPVRDVVAVYEVAGPDGTAIGVLCLIDPAAIDAHVWHSEEVYPRIVADRAAALTGLGRATSAALLVPVADGEDLTAIASAAVEGREPDVRTADAGGRAHRLWLLEDHEDLLRQVRRHRLLVADGNHRVAAASRANAQLLALVTSGPDLRIGAIHRVLTGTGLTTADLAAAWRGVGLPVHERPDPPAPDKPGLVTVPSGLVVELPATAEPLPRIDHGLVERLLIAEALGIDPEGPHVRALPEGHVPGGDVDAVLRLAPVPLADVLAVHDQGRRMPRKSTYFTPKPHSGLLIANISGEF
ncbi:DUF1015 domain-containing protein [Amycolatopsis sp. K13G38]|uniref:DUF1015 domain-containing protein n=1 Tax=Amycolatopsis acididurans TaxID=2724524 RepID=A0ABX1JFK2_9PSEU|nr:DUF1015 family protein [Amycolatopsis acididurans]NKQ58573.1 DUF1015 domain-containing protein [Amycolatopsis acididurans]